jgi:hypothetical protein
MHAELTEMLEDTRIALEVDSLTEESMFDYLYGALVECGIAPQSNTLDDLLDEAEEAWLAEADEGAKKTQKGWKMVFGVLRKVGKAVMRGGGKALQKTGDVAQKVGGAVAKLGQDAYDKRANWGGRKSGGGGAAVANLAGLAVKYAGKGASHVGAKMHALGKGESLISAETNDLLEDARIQIEVDALLTEESMFSYLHSALVECGIDPQSDTLDDLLDEAEAAWLAERRSPSRRRGAPPPSGWKQVFGVLRKVGKAAGKTALWTAGAALRGAGWAAKGLGTAASHVGQGAHNLNKKW